MADPYVHRLRADRLSTRRPTEVDLAPDAAARERIAGFLDLLDLPRVHLAGHLGPAPGEAWAFEGRLTAQVVQPCGVTLQPVATDIDEAVRRVWSPHADPSADLGTETEMGDDEVEPLGAEIDLGATLVEALALALPAFPRAPGATLEGTQDGDTGNAEDRRRPFTGLADLLKPEE